MKNLLISLTLFLVLFTMVGCTKYVELTKETFSRLDASKVMEVNVVSTGATPAEWKYPAKWLGIYRNVFPIRDSVRINTIFRCIHEANFIYDYTDDMKIPFSRILFKTEKVIYFMGIGWDDRFVYGDWWESEDMLLQFKQWGFELPKGESNLPPSREVYPHPPMDAKSRKGVRD